MTRRIWPDDRIDDIERAHELAIGCPPRCEAKGFCEECPSALKRQSDECEFCKEPATMTVAGPLMPGTTQRKLYRVCQWHIDDYREES